jgi:hypothetical protein
MAPPKEATPSTSTPKNQRSNPSVVPVHEDILGPSSLEPRFPRDYIPPRKDIAKPVNLSKDAKYELVEPKIPLGG